MWFYFEEDYFEGLFFWFNSSSGTSSRADVWLVDGGKHQSNSKSQEIRQVTVERSSKFRMYWTKLLLWLDSDIRWYKWDCMFHYFYRSKSKQDISQIQVNSESDHREGDMQVKSW